MDNNQVEVVAAADGVIIGKHDGEYGQQCEWLSEQWNAVYILHADGSQSWYGHLKRGSVTTKGLYSTVQKGEYLGVVGSSGNTVNPILHFEVYDANGNLIDPFGGPCNHLNWDDSWWVDQKPYYDSGINKMMTNSAYPQFGGCIARAKQNPKDDFAPGEKVYVTAYFRHVKSDQVSNWKLYRPDNTLEWSTTWYPYTSFSSPYKRTWWKGYDYALPHNAPTGTWKWTLSYQGQNYTHTFEVANSSNPCDNPTRNCLWTNCKWKYRTRKQQFF